MIGSTQNCSEKEVAWNEVYGKLVKIHERGGALSLIFILTDPF